VTPQVLRESGKVIEPVSDVSARKEMWNQTDTVTRSLRLLQEAEMCGNYGRAATFHQRLLVPDAGVDSTCNDPYRWLEYAKFLMRSGRRLSESAEFALVNALQRPAGSDESDPVANDLDVKNVKIMYAGLLIGSSHFNWANNS